MQTANEHALVALDEKDARISQFKKENDELRAALKSKSSSEHIKIAMEKRMQSLVDTNKQLVIERDNFEEKVQNLVLELEGISNI